MCEKTEKIISDYKNGLSSKAIKKEIWRFWEVCSYNLFDTTTFHYSSISFLEWKENGIWHRFIKKRNN